MEPESMVSKEFMQRTRVDFPDPDGPMIETTSAGKTLVLTPFSAWKEPNHLPTLLTFSNGSGSLFIRAPRFVTCSFIVLTLRGCLVRALVRIALAEVLLEFALEVGEDQRQGDVPDHCDKEQRNDLI